MASKSSVVSQVPTSFTIQNKANQLPSQSQWRKHSQATGPTLPARSRNAASGCRACDLFERTNARAHAQEHRPWLTTNRNP